ncbi:hypothetical protein BGZ82_011287, partial [Podila clonocystis]
MSTGGIIGIVVAALLAVIAAVIGLFLIKRRRRRRIDGAGQVMFNPVGLDLSEKYYGSSGGGGGARGSGGSGHDSAASDSVLGGVTAVSGVSAMAGGQTAGVVYSDSGYHPEMVSYHPPMEPSYAHYGYDQYDPGYLAQQEEATYLQYQQEQLYQQYQEQMAAEHAAGEGMVGGLVSYYPSAAQLRYQQQPGEQDYEDYTHLYRLTRDGMAP